MNREQAQKVVNELNTEYRDLINKSLYNKLGVTVDMEASFTEGRSDCYITLKDTNNNEDVDKKMRGNKILRALFASVSLNITAYEFSDSYTFSVGVSYRHNDGGSNGHSLFYMYIDKNTKKVSYR